MSFEVWCNAPTFSACSDVITCSIKLAAHFLTTISVAKQFTASISKTLFKYFLLLVEEIINCKSSKKKKNIIS